jgi:hypothetical protein
VSGKAAVVFCGLPVDGLEAILKLGGRTEFPFADNGPDYSTASNRCGEHDENGYGRTRKT